MGTVIPFPNKQRDPLIEDERGALKDAIMGLCGFEMGLDESASNNEDYKDLWNDTDEVIRTLFGDTAKEFVWSWLRVWCEVNLLSDAVAEEAAPLKAAVNTVLDALFDRDRSIDTSYNVQIQIRSRCEHLKSLELTRIMSQ